MRIGILSWKSFGIEDIIEAFTQLGHCVKECPFSDESEPEDGKAVQELTKKLQDLSCDVLFSFNYFPIAAIACKNLGMPYISWIYDSPYVRMYHYSVAYPTNYVFVFDKAVFLEFYRGGIATVHYLPMAANVKRLQEMNDFGCLKSADKMPEHPVAFVGSLYTEKHRFFERLKGISDYTQGYLEGLMEAQKLVYGYNFIQDLLTARIVADMRKSLPVQVHPGGAESVEYLLAQYVINRQITAVERSELLAAAAKQYGLDLYTPDKTVNIPGCSNHGTVEAYDQAPYVYKTAAINLNITLRSILSGIPLRAFEIMGAGGFLLTNFQEDFLDCFVPGEDFVYYESKADMLDKIGYYLQHEQERVQIAQSGLQKVAKGHTYLHRAEEMLSILKG